MTSIDASSQGCQPAQQDILDFLKAIHGDDLICFQTFDDAKKGRNNLVGNWHAPANHETLERLAQLNSQGAGIYHTVNATDGHGRKERNITGLTALFADYDDGAPLNLDKLPPPSAIILSKKGEHLYWFLHPGQPVNQFTAYQEMLIGLTGADKVVKDLPRVLRLPGFDHLKDPADPFMVQLLELHPERRYTLEDFPTPDTAAIATSKKKTAAKRSKKASTSRATGLTGLIEATAEYRAITKPKGIKPEKEAALKHALVKYLKTVPLGGGADDAILKASRRCSELLLRTTEDVEAVVEKILGWVTPIYEHQVCERAPWRPEKAYTTIINGLRYGAAAALEQLSPDDLTIKDATLVDARYVADMGVDIRAAKLTAIASPIGTGKTTYINRVIADTLAVHPATHIRIFTHRTALVAGWAGVVPGAILYNDHVTLAEVNNIHSVHTYVGTYDSLARFANGSLPSTDTILILDEVDQALHYLFTCKETSIANTRKSCYDALRLLCQRSSHIIATSATLGQREVDVLCHLAKWGEEEVSKQVYVNTRKPKQKDFFKVNTEAEAVALVIKFLEEGKKVYVASDSSSKAETYRVEMEAFQPDRKYAVITADSKCEYDLVNINQTVMQYDCVIASPTLGTGIDINCEHFDEVVLIGTNGTDIGYDSLGQAAGRVRYPRTGKVHCYVNEAFRWFETDVDVLKEYYDIGQEGIAAFVFEVHLSQWSKEQLVVNAHTDLAFIQQTTAEYLAKEARAKVARADKFWQVVRESGHNVLDYAEPTHLVDEEGKPLINGSSLYRSREEVKDAKTVAVAQAAVVSEEAVTGLRKKMERGERITKAQKDSVSRYFVSRALYPDDNGEAMVTADEVDWYNSGGRKTIHTLKMMSQPAFEAFKCDIAQNVVNVEDGGYDADFYLRSRHHLLALYEAAKPFLTSSHPGYSKEEIEGFTAAVEAIGTAGVSKLGIKVDMTKPCTAVGSFLRLIGYQVECIRGRGGVVLGYNIYGSRLTSLLHDLHKPEGDEFWVKVAEKQYHKESQA